MVNRKSSTREPSGDAHLEKMKTICKCDKLLSDKDLDLLKRHSKSTKKPQPSPDEFDEKINDEFLNLREALKIPQDRYSLGQIEPNLPQQLKCIVKSGKTHMYDRRYPPFSRGHQGVAIAVAAYATSAVTKPQNWNPATVDRILDDGDDYFHASYEKTTTPDRRELSVRGLRPELIVQDDHRVNIAIKEPSCAGSFRSETPGVPNVARALQKCFEGPSDHQREKAAVLVSPVLNLAIWRSGTCYCLFDGQPRMGNAERATTGDRKDDGEAVAEGSAMLLMVRELADVCLVILERSGVENESFVLYGLEVLGVKKISEEESPCGPLESAQRRPSGYAFWNEFQAVVQGSRHIQDLSYPEEFRGKNHLTVAVAMLIYSKLANAKKWTGAMIDLILNQSMVYYVDLVRATDKKNGLTPQDLLCDVFLGVYTVKISVENDVVPGSEAKGLNLDEGLRYFFKERNTGLLDVNKAYFAIWRENNNYFIFDPFACDEKGSRLGAEELEDETNKKKAASCIIMNASIDELSAFIMQNNGIPEKGPYMIHGLRVLYVKTGTKLDGSDEVVIYRGENVNRKPERLEAPVEEPEASVDKCPRVREDCPRFKEQKLQYPDLMLQIEIYIPPESNRDNEIEINKEEEQSSTSEVEFPPLNYKMINPRRVWLQSRKNSFHGSFHRFYRGKQGLLMAISILARARMTHPAEWDSADLDEILEEGNRLYAKIVQGHSIEDLDDDGEEAQETVAEEEGKATEEPDEDGKILFDHVDLGMIPEFVKVHDERVNILSREKTIAGVASPLVNLGEALERYFDLFDQVLLENKQLFYAILRVDEKFLIFNPYGSDEDGYLSIVKPAALFVVSNLNELVDYLYGLLEMNDLNFILNFIRVTLVNAAYEPGVNQEKLLSKLGSDLKFKTKFLPITDEDVVKLGSIDKHTSKFNGDEQESGKSIKEIVTYGPLDLFPHLPEPKESDTPKTLNLALTTGLVKIEDIPDKSKKIKGCPEVLYEHVKYKHSPPYLTPPKKTFCDLLDSKPASKSIHSLVSRFSIDSLLVSSSDDPPESRKNTQMNESSKTCEDTRLISLTPEKYFYSKMLSNGLTPIRAIDEAYIRDKDEAKEKQNCKEEKPKEKQVAKNMKIENPEPELVPTILPLGPCISSPKPCEKLPSCPPDDDCACDESAKENKVLAKLVCSTENLLLEMICPEFKCPQDYNSIDEMPTCNANDECVICDEGNESLGSGADSWGFEKTDDEAVGVVLGHTSLESRESTSDTHYKPCYFSALLCILARINVDVVKFRRSIVDQIIDLSNRIVEETGPLRIKLIREFVNVHILDTNFNVIVKQVRYADAEHHEPDELSFTLPSFLEVHKTGLIVFKNVTYAIWETNGHYYVFDPYACDDNGRAVPQGQGCLMQICDINAFLDRIIENTGSSARKPYRLYTVKISRLVKTKKKRAKRSKQRKECPETESIQYDYEEDLEVNQELEELAEKPEWLLGPEVKPHDLTKSSFQPVPNFDVSALEVNILENEVTRPQLPPLKCPEIKVPDDEEPERMIPYDRKFYEHSGIAEPIDICFMAWAQIKDPTTWSTRTYQSLFEAAAEYAQDSLLAAEDSTVSGLTDELLSVFTIGNYCFRVVFTPVHCGTLYSRECRWNLATALDNVFESDVFSGTVVLCGNAHFGAMKRYGKYLGWWPVPRSKRLRVIVSESLEDYLRLLVRQINEPNETGFYARTITISYAYVVGPNCSDISGLHESIKPTASLPEIHRKFPDALDVQSIFRRVPQGSSTIIRGSVALRDREDIVEPWMKRCYFVSLVALLFKADIVDNPLPGMVDRMLELGDVLYKNFEQPKYHTEHILRNVTLLGRVFDFRDCSSRLVRLQDEDCVELPFVRTVKQQLKDFFGKHSAGLIQFPNMCYAFWYSEVNRHYYLLDPYQCDSKGRRVTARGKACLTLFSSVCDLVKQMARNRLRDTTGFYLHRIHVESVNALPCDKFQEDPMWMYLDYHWSAPNRGSSKRPAKKSKPPGKCSKGPRKGTWKNYAIDVPDLIYSLWGTIGSYDSSFHGRAGKNQVAINLALVAMQSICQPSEWRPAILDSAVLCGDFYYRQSLRMAKQCGNENLNKYGLLAVLEAPPHIWHFEFEPENCGHLYESRSEANLANMLDMTLTRSPNILLECAGKHLGVIRQNDGYYAFDPSWIGPPLFARDRSALYVVRCKNLNALTYVVAKMINSNRREKFVITRIKMKYLKEETSTQSRDRKGKLVDEPVLASPGKVCNSKANTSGKPAPDTDCYLSYRKSLRKAQKIGEQLERMSLDSYFKSRCANEKTIASHPEDCSRGAVPKSRKLPSSKPMVPSETGKNGARKYNPRLVNLLRVDPEVSIVRGNCGKKSMCRQQPAIAKRKPKCPGTAETADCRAREFLEERGELKFGRMAKKLFKPPILRPQTVVESCLSAPPPPPPPPAIEVHGRQVNRVNK